MDMKEMDKSETRTVSLPISMWETVEKRAQERFGGKRSSYIKSLVTNDSGSDEAGPRNGPTILEDLVRHYRPALMAQVASQMAHMDQERFLDRLIEQISEAMRIVPKGEVDGLVVIPKSLYIDLLYSCDPKEIERIIGEDEGLKDYKDIVAKLIGSIRPELSKGRRKGAVKDAQ
jgi:hypothetical protein